MTAEKQPAGSPEGLDIFYQPVWQEWLPEGSAAVRDDRGTVLVIQRREDPAVWRLISALHPETRVVKVNLGSAFRTHAPDELEIDHRSQRDFGAAVDSARPLGAVYFLGLPAAEGEGPLEEAFELGALSFFRLVQALTASGGILAAPLPLTVLASGAYAVDTTGREPLQPPAASLLALAKVAARESPGLAVTCIDLGDGAPGLLERILRCRRGGAELAVRRGRAWRRVLEPLGLAQPGRRDLPLRRGGAYLILGEGGEIGFEVARQLTSTYGAAATLVGRRADLEPEKLQQIESQGGKILYCQGDVADPECLLRVVRLARERFGAIRGALHAATAGGSVPLSEMTAAELREGLGVKVQGSWNLYQATREEPLDFLVFFSSFQSLYGGHGAAIEAAGGAFADTFAAALTRAGASANRVQSIDWGPWLETGRPAEPEMAERPWTEGIHGLSFREGLRAWTRVLAQPAQQVVAARPSSRALQAMEWAPAPDVPLRSAVQDASPFRQAGEHLRGPAADETRRLTQAPVEDAMFSALDRYGELLALRFLESRGFLRAAGEEHSIASLAAGLAVAERHERLFRAVLRLLCRSRWIEIEEDCIRTSPQLDRDLGALVSEEGRRLLASHPLLEHHVRLLETCAGRLGEVLSDEVPATFVLFPDGSPVLVEPVYRNSPGAVQFDRVHQLALARIVEACLARNGRETVRILEVGAGTGATTASLLAALQPFADRVEYHYTDLSLRFLDLGEKKFAAFYPFLKLGLLNLDQDPGQHGWTAGSFQVVVAANVLHATADLGKTLRYLRGLLSPEGGLLISELTRPGMFLTLTFGLLDGWWQYRDWPVRLPGSPLLSVSRWRSLLAGECFRTLEVFGLAQENAADPAQALILAERE